MKKSSIQSSIGFLPILLGFCSRLIFRLPLPLFMINLFFFALWIWLCFRFCDPVCPVMPQFLRVCLPGAAVVALAVWQELVPEAGLPGIIIYASQFYYLSGLSLVGRILTPFLRVISASPYILADYLVLTATSLLCMILKKKVA